MAKRQCLVVSIPNEPNRDTADDIIMPFIRDIWGQNITAFVCFASLIDCPPGSYQVHSWKDNKWANFWENLELCGQIYGVGRRLLIVTLASFDPTSFVQALTEFNNKQNWREGVKSVIDSAGTQIFPTDAGSRPAALGQGVNLDYVPNRISRMAPTEWWHIIMEWLQVEEAEINTLCAYTQGAFLASLTHYGFLLQLERISLMRLVSRMGLLTTSFSGK